MSTKKKGKRGAALVVYKPKTVSTSKPDALSAVERIRMELDTIHERIASCATVTDAKDCVDTATALGHWAKVAKLSLVTQNGCAFTKVMAQRRIGQLLHNMELSKGRPEKMSPKDTLSGLCIRRPQSALWQKFAAVEEGVFAQWLQKCNEKGEEFTRAYVSSMVTATLGATADRGTKTKRSLNTIASEVAKATKSLQQGRLFDLGADVFADPHRVVNPQHIEELSRELNGLLHEGGVWKDALRAKANNQPVRWEPRPGKTLLTPRKADRTASSEPARVVVSRSAPDGSRRSLRVLSCVPQQKYTFTDKLRWVEEQIEKHKPDVVVLPQEFHGGVQCEFFAAQMKEAATKNKAPEKMSYAPEEITGPYTALATKHGVGIIVGAVIDCPELGERRERIYVIDPNEGVTGHSDKMFLPAYDHVGAKGRTRIYPETDLEKRAVTHPLMGSRVSILFCWESHSGYLWHAISRAQPDWVASMVKFGVKGYPKKEKINGESSVTGFGFGDDGRWLERLQMAARFDLAAPIICSTNSWNLPNKCGAIAGQMLPWEEKAAGGKEPRAARSSTLWVSEGKGDLTDDHVQVDQVDFMYWRYIRENKFALRESAGEWPSSEARALTMSWKIKRMERKVAGLPKLTAEAEVRPVGFDGERQAGGA